MSEQTEIERLKAELADAIASKEHSRQWYAARLEPLKDWARSDLSEPLKEQFFNIIANASKSVHEKPPSLTAQLNLMRHERDALRPRCERLERALREAQEYLRQIKDLPHADYNLGEMAAAAVEIATEALLAVKGVA